MGNPRRTRVRLKRSGDMFVGHIEMPALGATLAASAVGLDRAEALHRASLIAERVMSDPVLSALIPPQVIPAVMAVKSLATAARRGRGALKSIWRRFRGPGKRRLAKVLAHERPRSRPLAPVQSPQDETPEGEDEWPAHWGKPAPQGGEDEQVDGPEDDNTSHDYPEGLVPEWYVDDDRE